VQCIGLYNYAKTVFSMLQCFIHLKLKFCCWGFSPKHPPGLCPWTTLGDFRPLGSLKPGPPATKIQLCPWWIPMTSAPHRYRYALNLCRQWFNWLSVIFY